MAWDARSGLKLNKPGVIRFRREGEMAWEARSMVASNSFVKILH